MAGAHGGILCLSHGAEGQAADKSLLRCPLNPVQKFLHFSWVDFSVLSPHGVSEIVDKCSQPFHLLRVGIIVGPIDEGKFLPEIILRNGLIGYEHKIFDDLCGCIPLIGLYIHHFSSAVQQNPAFRKIKVNGSPLPPLLP